MYIEIHNKKEPFAIMSEKLTRALDYAKGHPAFLQIVELKGKNTFAIIRREPADTFKTQCCMVHIKKEKGRFNLTIPSVEYLCAIMNIPQFKHKTFNVEKCTTSNNITYYKILCK
jgi:hypothetical protein